MISVEMKRIIKEGWIIFCILIVLLISLLTTNKDVYIAPMFEIFLLLYASFTGWSMFERERDEGAMEFMLQLPVSRYKLLFLKLFPRILAVLFILLFYHLILNLFNFPFLLSGFVFTLFFISVFLISLSFSLSMKSFIGTFFLTLFATVGLFYFIKYLDFSKPAATVAVQTSLSILIFPISFFVLFRKFDIKPISNFNKKFVPLLILLLVLLLSVTYLIMGRNWWYCYLTDDGSIIRSSYTKTVLLKEKNKIVTFDHVMAPILEDNGKIYAVRFWKGRKKPEHLLRLNLETKKVEILYQTEVGWWFHKGAGIQGGKLHNSVYFLLTNINHKSYKVLEVKENKIRILPVKANFGEEGIHRIVHAVDNPLQFIVCTGSIYTDSTVYRIFESGETEKLFAADGISVWKNRILVINKTEMVLYEIGEEIRPIFQQSGKIRIARRKFANYQLKEVLIKIDKLYQVFNMENKTLKKTNIKIIPYYYLPSADGLRIVWIVKDEVTVSELIDGRLTIEKVWYPPIEGFKIYRVFSSGIAVYNHKALEVYWFPES